MSPNKPNKKNKTNAALQFASSDYLRQLHNVGMFPEDDNYDEIPRTRNNPEPNPPPKQRVHSKKILAEKLDFCVPAKIKPEPIFWELRIEKLEKFFENINLPTNSISLNPWTTINDIPGFVESHLTLVKTCNRNRLFLPYLERLEQLSELLQAYKSNSY